MANQISQIPPDSSFRGEARFSSELVVHGSLEGSVHGSGKLKIEKQGSCKGDVSSQEIQVLGKLQGNIVSSQFVHIEKGGQVLGDMECQELQIDRGGKHSGTTLMNHV